MTRNAILGCGKWCCNRHNRYRRNFLVQIGLAMGQVFRKCEICGHEPCWVYGFLVDWNIGVKGAKKFKKFVGRSNSDSDELVR